MVENELNALPEVVGDVPPEITPEPVATPAPTEPPAAPDTPPVDVEPEAAALQADIDKLKERKDKAKKEAGYWQRKEAESRRAAFQPSPPAPPASAETPMKAPKQDDFEDYNDYVNAVADHKVAVAQEQWRADDKTRSENEGNAKRQADLKIRLDEGYTKYDDFAEVAFDEAAIHITPVIVDILADCDNPADVAYYLAKNQVEGVAISRMTPTMAARKIAEIDAQYTKPAAPGPGKTITDAPPPITPVGSTHTVGKDPDKMTQPEFEDWRNKQGAKRF